jgi:hypothetical protein
MNRTSVPEASQEDAKPWWMKELALQAATTHHPEDPTDEPGLHLLQARLYSLAEPMDETRAVLWSAQESGNFVDLANDDDGMLQVKKVKKEVLVEKRPSVPVCKSH